MSIQDWKRNHLYINFGKKTNGKSKETFILNAIWNRMEMRNISIESITQQIVHKPDGSYFLLDLYFPAIHVAIECDEAYHLKVDQIECDLRREKQIEQIFSASRVLTAVDEASLKIYRVNAEATLEEIYEQIDNIIEQIQLLVHSQERKFPGSTLWKSPDEKIAIYAHRKFLSAEEPIYFRTINDIYQLFQPQGNAPILRGFFRLAKSEYFLWFPQLAIEVNGLPPKSQNSKGWMNFLDQNTFSIIERNNDLAVFQRSVSHIHNPRLAFVKVKTPLNETGYRFIGVYRIEKETLNEKINKRIGTKIHWEINPTTQNIAVHVE